MPAAHDISREFEVEGIAVNVHSLTHAVSTIIDAAKRGRTFCVFTLNLDHCNKLRTDPQFRAAYRRAAYVTADGFPIVLLGRLNGVHVRRTTGADLLVPLWAEAAHHHLPIFLLGPSQSVNHFAVDELRRELGNFEIAGTYAPSSNFDPTSPEADLIIKLIRESYARICILAIGAPRQEIFAARCLDRLDGVGLVCVGAAADFIAGSQRRAPPFFRSYGLEWLWRLSSDPGRLGLRYARCAAAVPRLVFDAIPQAIAARRGRT